MHQAHSTPQLPLPATRHARIRCQQRGIPLELVDLLFEYGEERHVGGGATMLTFPRRCREKLRRCLPRKRYAAISSRLDVYAVLGEHGQVMTVGHRYQPILDKKH